jgi:DDE superfamily endonuclease
MARVAAVPEETEFATKPELARRMIERALAAGAPCSWVAADEVYGNNSKLRQWLEERRLGYVLTVASDQRFRWPDGERRRVDTIAQSLPALAWERVSAGSGSKGERFYDWTLIRGWEEDGWSHGLLVRRSIEEQPEHAYYRFYAPTKPWCGWRDNAGRLNRRSRPPRASAAWITMKSDIGKAGIGTSRQPCWPTRCWPCCAHLEKKLQTCRCPSAYSNCGTCSRAYSGADGMGLTICCAGPNGENSTNSTRFAATTANVVPRSQSSIYNWSARRSISMQE